MINSGSDGLLTKITPVSPKDKPEKALRSLIRFDKLKNWWWVVLLIVIVAATLSIDATFTPLHQSLSQKAQALDAQIRCPVCVDLSVLQSETAIASTIRHYVFHELSKGYSDAQIKSFLVQKYGSSILMKPPLQGMDWWLWLLPPVAIFLVVSALILWRYPGLRKRLWPGEPSLGFLRNTPSRWRYSGILWMALILLVGIAGGVVLEKASTQRLPGNTFTGGITLNTAQKVNLELSQAGYLITKDKYLEAIKLYQKILQLSPNQPQALTDEGWLINTLGVSSHSSLLVQEGFKLLQKAVNNDPNYADAHGFLGYMLLADKHNSAQAAIQFNEFVALHPSRQMLLLMHSAMVRVFKGHGSPSNGIGGKLP